MIKPYQPKEHKGHAYDLFVMRQEDGLWRFESEATQERFVELLRVSLPPAFFHPVVFDCYVSHAIDHCTAAGMRNINTTSLSLVGDAATAIFRIHWPESMGEWPIELVETLDFHLKCEEEG